MDVDWVINALLLTLTLAVLYLYGTWPFSLWAGCGIQGPAPLPFLGNAWTIGKQGLFRSTLEWSKKYGKIYGIYLMREPMLMTTDIDILRQVFIKDFNNFSHRAPDIDLLPYPVGVGLSLVGGQQWRRQRCVLNPSFSTSKLKRMDDYVQKCCGNLVKNIGEAASSERPVQVGHLFGAYTLDVIAATTLGLETNSLSEDKNAFLTNAKAVLGSSSLVTMPTVLAATFPVALPLLEWLGCSAIPLKETKFIAATIQALVEQRRQEPRKGAAPDLMQLMLNAELPHDAPACDPTQAKYLTKDEIIAQGITFFVAGYDTTAICLKFLSYLLALHPDKQDKLHSAIAQVSELSYEQVTKVDYLDCCIRETLRLFPPLPLVARKSSADWTVGGVSIPAGTSVGTSVYALMRDEEFFPQPDQFIPERFEGERRAAIPPLVRDMVFGAGPRQCIGMRLALYEAKMAAVAILKQFRFVKVKDTPETITLSASIMCTSEEAIVVGCQRHSDQTTPLRPRG